MKALIKQIIKDYLKSKLNNNTFSYNLRYNHRKYLFLRWLAEICKEKQQTDDVIADIANYVQREIPRLASMFSDLFVIDNYVYIQTKYPGMWIGKGGSTIDAIADEINNDANGNKMYNYEIKLLEDDSSSIYTLQRWSAFYNSNY